MRVHKNSPNVTQPPSFSFDQQTKKYVDAKDIPKDEKRKLRDGEVVTACQQACPCSAIEFGDLNDSKSQVTKLSKDKRSYKLLKELNTRPSISYLKKIEWDGA